MNKREPPKTLDEVEPGDELVYEPSRGYNHLVKIRRVTKTMLIVSKDVRFNIRTGRHSGAVSWNNNYVRIPEPGEIEEIRKQTRRRDLAYHLKYNDWTTLSLADLERVAAIVEASDE